jgi:AraC family transcriptional activator of pobA
VAASANPAVPAFFLYGEPVRDVKARFLHVEPLHERTRPPSWTIQPHTHLALSQIIALTRGGGTMAADGARLPFTSPCLLVIPAAVVHAFSFDRGTAGKVLTIGDLTLLDLVTRDAALARLFEAPAVITHGSPREARQLQLVLRQLAIENAWEAPGHQAVLDALLVMVLVIALRATASGSTVGAVGRGDAHLVARFRQSVEVHFRRRPKLDRYLRELGVSEAQLRRACTAVARRTPLRIVQERTILEAKRMLLHSNSTSEEIAGRLGFDDAAYFSRFFRSMTGVNARSFRAAGHRGSPDRGDQSG